MHFEILVEDSSGACLLGHLMPKLLGPRNDPHSWRLHSYKGIGRIPAHLDRDADPARRLLLTTLPAILRGYAKTPGYDAVVVVCDADTRNCYEFLAELRNVARSSGADAITLFRLAIEEMEAWYLGDRAAVMEAYPAATRAVMDTYVQDSICGTWEKLADAIHPGGVRAIRTAGWPVAGNVKHEWANRIGPLMNPDRNQSYSFGKFCDGVRRLAMGGLGPS